MPGDARTDPHLLCSTSLRGNQQVAGCPLRDSRSNCQPSITWPKHGPDPRGTPRPSFGLSTYDTQLGSNGKSPHVVVSSPRGQGRRDGRRRCLPGRHPLFLVPSAATAATTSTPSPSPGTSTTSGPAGPSAAEMACDRRPWGLRIEAPPPPRTSEAGTGVGTTCGTTLTASTCQSSTTTTTWSFTPGRSSAPPR